MDSHSENNPVLPPQVRLILGLVFILLSVGVPQFLILSTVMRPLISCGDLLWRSAVPISVISVKGRHGLFEPHSYMWNMCVCGCSSSPGC